MVEFADSIFAERGFGEIYLPTHLNSWSLSNLLENRVEKLI